MQMMKLSAVFFPFSCYFLLFGPNTLLRTLFSEYCQSTFFPLSERPTFTPIHKHYKCAYNEWIYI
jgi:hypothetical protein